jgi:hypothetical protein
VPNTPRPSAAFSITATTIAGPESEDRMLHK